MKLKLKMTFTLIFSGICFLGALIIGGSALIGKIFWPNTYSLHTFFYIFLGYVSFFLVFLGVVIPILRWVLKILKIHKINPFDGIATVLLFILSFFPIVILALIIKLVLKKSKERPYKFFHAAILTMLFFAGVIIRYFGDRYKGQCIFALNHTSDLDYPLGVDITGGRSFNIVAGINLSENKNKLADKIVFYLFGDIIREYAITVDRKDKESRKDVFWKTKKELKEGKSIVIFPEDGRTPIKDIRDGMLLRKFKDGTFIIAWDENMPIQPVALIFPAVWHGKDDDRIGLHPCDVLVKFLPVLFPRDFDSIELLKNACWLSINDELQKSKKVRRFINKATP